MTTRHTQAGPPRGPRADRQGAARRGHPGPVRGGHGPAGLGRVGGQRGAARSPQHAVEELDRVIRDLRNYIFGLRPGILADRQLAQALQRLCEEFQERTGVVTIAEIDPHVAAELASQAGEVVQLAREALSNVSRHAEAATCRVSLYRR